MSRVMIAAAVVGAGSAAAIVAFRNVREGIGILAKGIRLVLLDAVSGEAASLPVSNADVAYYLRKKLGGQWRVKRLEDTGGIAARYLGAHSEKGVKVFIKLSSDSLVKRILEAAIGLALEN